MFFVIFRIFRELCISYKKQQQLQPDSIVAAVIGLNNKLLTMMLCLELLSDGEKIIHQEIRKSHL